MTKFKKFTKPKGQFLDEGDTVWVKATVVRGGGIGDVTMVAITDFKNAPPGETHFMAVFPNEVLRGEWRNND